MLRAQTSGNAQRFWRLLEFVCIPHGPRYESAVMKSTLVFVLALIVAALPALERNLIRCSHADGHSHVVLAALHDCCDDDHDCLHSNESSGETILQDAGCSHSSIDSNVHAAIPRPSISLIDAMIWNADGFLTVLNIPVIAPRLSVVRHVDPPPLVQFKQHATTVIVC